MSGTAAAFTPRARREVREAAAWIARENATAAGAFLGAIAEAAARIGRNPAIGSRRPALARSQFRFWPLPRYGYLVVYSEATTPPSIVRIVHMARDLPKALAELRE